MEGALAGTERAVVTFDAPHGRDLLVLHDGEIAEFGRGGSCRIRFAFAPVSDEAVPRVAGRLVIAGDRVFIEATDAARRPSIQVMVKGRPTVMVAVGDGFSPAEPEFQVGVPGSIAVWCFLVRVRRERHAPAPDGSTATRSYEVQFSDRQRRILGEYVKPLTRGHWEPATHREVGVATGLHPNTCREALYDAWSLLFAAGVPLPDISDKRLAVAEALRLHRLLPDADGP
jgi:hypothetical protein